MNKHNITKPRVFISYSWDSDEHKNKVKNFAQKLRAAGINVVYDDDMELGDRITNFMENSVIECDIVLFICTPQYKQKADKRIGGVGYENNIITAELYETQYEDKFIPVLFEGIWKESVPIWAKGKMGVDLSNPSKYDDEYERLLQKLISLYGDGCETNEINIIINRTEGGKIRNFDIEINDRFTDIFGIDEDLNENQVDAQMGFNKITNSIKYKILESMKYISKDKKDIMIFCPRDVDSILSNFMLFHEQNTDNENIEGQKFSLFDNCNLNTIVYEVVEKPNVITKRYHLYAERIVRSSESFADGRSLRTFYIDQGREKGNSLIFLTFGNSFVMVNTGMLIDHEVKVSKNPLIIESDEIVSEQNASFIIQCNKEFVKDEKVENFMGDPDSNTIIIDMKTQEEVKRKIFYDSNQDQWSCSMDIKLYHSYFAFQVRSKNGYKMNDIQIATSYEKGNGNFPISFLEALKYYELAECPEGDYCIGLIFLRNNEFHDIEKGFYYLYTAANADYVPAMVSLAGLYLCGKFCEQNLEKAFYWWQKAIITTNSIIKEEEKSQYFRLEKYFNILNIISNNLYDKMMIVKPVYLKYTKDT